MKAAVLYAPGDLRVEEWPDPVAGPDDLIIEVSYNGLCGTDATEYTKGPMMVPLNRPHPGSGHVGPTILGHEFIGTVVDAGVNARSWIGRRVASGAGVSCGSCRRCKEGRTNLCERYFTLGLSTHGGLAQFVASPASICVEIPAECADRDAALAQPLAVGLHAVNRAQVKPGDDILLLGAGAIGSFIAAGLQSHDGRVVAADIDSGRLEAVKKLGVSETLLLTRDASGADTVAGLGGQVDIVFETSGVTGAVDRAITATRSGGSVMLVGLNKSPQPLVLADPVLREISFGTTVAHVCRADLPASLALLARNPLSDLLVGTIAPLSDVVRAGFDPLVAGRAGGKVLVDARI